MALTPERLTIWREALGGRRFLMCMGAEVVNTALFVFGLMTEGGYITAFLATVGAYLAANGYQKHIETKSAPSS